MVGWIGHELGRTSLFAQSSGGIVRRIKYAPPEYRRKWKDLLINLLFSITWVMHCMEGVDYTINSSQQANNIKTTRKNFTSIQKKCWQGSVQGNLEVVFRKTK